MTSPTHDDTNPKTDQSQSDATPKTDQPQQDSLPSANIDPDASGSVTIDFNDRSELLKVVDSCIATKFTRRFGTLIPV